MNVSSRREVIRTLLGTKPFISLEELTAAFPEVSQMTLRRDIEYFEKQGEAIKVRGGARSMKFITTSMEDSFFKRLHENIYTKENLAMEAVKLIETGRSVFLDSGTTMLTLASLLPDERFTVITTGPNVALEIIKKRKPIVNIVGGMLNRDNISVVGNKATEFIDSINIDIAFIVPSGVSADGLTGGNYTECEIKKKVIEKAHKVVALINLSKMNKILPYNVCSLDDVDVIITDRKPPADMAQRLNNGKTEIIITQ